MSQSKTDLILLHAPSIYDFRKTSQMFGPISDVVPSSSIFEMYPIGFMIMLGYLKQHGYSVRIINVALKMLKNRKLDVEKLISSLRAHAFGIDLHWLPHAQGSLAIAEIIKKYHPDTPVLFGGLSSSYFHKELIAYPQVDYVLRGDSVEEPLHMLLERIKSRRSPEDVPNLTWKSNGKTVVVNKLTHSPDNLDFYPFDYGAIIKSTIKHADLFGHLPFFNWLNYPIVAMLPWKGCVHNCIICGGAAHFYKNFCGRSAPAYRSPALIAKDAKAASRLLKGPIILLGELRQAGDAYAQELLTALKAEKISNHVAIELFYPASRLFLEAVADALPRFNIEISPESHDETIRNTFGRHYGNEALEQTIQHALELGCKRIDLFFMIGLAGQTPQSVMDTVTYCEYLIQKFRSFGTGKVLPCISPLAPFIDPGSLVFENPGKYGYRLFYKTLEEHRRALLMPSWKYMLNYETQWMSRDEIVSTTYEAALRLNRIKATSGIIRQQEADLIDRRITEAKQQIQQTDAMLEAKEAGEKISAEYGKKFNVATICKKDELQWPLNPLRFNPFSIIKTLLSKK